MKSKNGKTIQKISMFAVMVLLICMTCAVAVSAESSDYIIGDACYSLGDVNEDGVVSKNDAVYLLYNSVYPEDYPLSWSGDFAENDEQINVKDAIYLWNHANEPEFMGKMVHAYSEPVWKWTTENGNVSAVATYNCACGDVNSVKVVDAALEVTTKASTCIENGSTAYAATAICMDQEYHADKIVESEAKGHVFAETTNACEERVCTNEGCNYVEKADSHAYVVSEKVEATCTAAAVVTYTCESCGDTYTNEEGLPAGHKIDDGKLQQVEGCNYEMVYTCTVCKEVVEKETVVKHTHVAAVTTEETCIADGVKTYTCSCGDTYTEAIPANVNAHSWDKGVVEGNITTYTCDTCGTTRTTIDASEAKEAKVTSEDLAKAGEVEVNNTAIKLDEATLGQLSGDVAISAGEADKTSLNLAADLAEQIGANPVYDFSITANGEAVSEFNGTVTISLPYTLQEGDDVDCIDVWFIGADGSVNVQEGTYSNGFVTFTTDHFSYYTVTRLTPAQRCEKYGHSLTTRVVEPTCVAEGYTLGVCVRCGETSKTDIKEALGHDCEVVTVAATCTKAGSEEEACKVCDYKRTSKLPALGHDWKEIETTEATCANAGHTKSECANCAEVKEKDIKQLAHNLETDTVAATCTEKGYESVVCKDCGYVKEETEAAVLGHDYKESWQWNEEGGISAVLKLTCQREDCSHSVAKKGVVEVAGEVFPTCENDGSVAYKASIAHNGKTYKNDDYKIVVEKLGHDMSAEWKSNSESHYHECTRCDYRADETKHTLGEAVVKDAASCTEDGMKTYTCTECNREVEEKIAALGHDIVNGVCTRCGYNATGCTHELSEEIWVNLKDYGMCDGTFAYATCKCGENKLFKSYDLRCDFVWDKQTTEDENGYAVIHNTATCKDCGFRIEEAYRFEVAQNECIGTAYMEFSVYNKNEEQIFAFNGFEAKNVSHLKVCFVETEELTKYGLCGGIAKKAACACGAETEYVVEDDTCNWVHVQEGSAEGIGNTYRCSDCNTVKVESWEDTALENCQYASVNRTEYYRDNTLLVKYENSGVYTYHNNEYSFELDGESCLDGYTVSTKCKDCGFENSYYEKSNHAIFWKQIDVSAYDLCLESAEVAFCACGEYEWCDIANNCNLIWQKSDSVASDGTGNQTVVWHECSDCGLNVEERIKEKPTGDSCKIEQNVTNVYTKNGEAILTTFNTYIVDAHNGKLIKSELKGNSCEDGVKATYECSVCGEVYTEEYSWHKTSVLKTHDLKELGLCGGKVSVIGCACGQERWISHSYECNWQYVGYDSTTGSNTYKCSDCGIYRRYSYIQETSEGCMVKRIERYEYLNDTTVLLTVDAVSMGYSHQYEYTFELDGETCSDGYTMIGTCKNCEATTSWHETTPEGMHYTYQVERYELADYGFCGGFVIQNGCPCGENYHVSWNLSSCIWDGYNYDYETGTTTRTCSTCGSSYAQKQGETVVDGCNRYVTTIYKFYDADKVEKVSLESKSTYVSHTYEYTFELDGETCSDGYDVIEECTICGITYTFHEQPSEGTHWTYAIERYNLKDEGFCGYEIIKYSCPCGENTYVSYSNYNGCNFIYKGWDEETQSDMYECETCGSSYIRLYTEKEIDACHSENIRTYKFFNKAGEMVYTYDDVSENVSHAYTATFEMKGDSCEDGYTVYQTCKNCGDTIENYRTYHQTYVVDVVDFEELGFCGGTFEKRSCACGEYTYTNNYSHCYFSYSGYDEETGTSVYECSTCGGIRTEKTVQGQKDESCRYINTTYVQYSLDDEVLYEYSYNSSYTSHNYVYSFELLGETCADGYYVISTCVDCGYSYEDNYLYDYDSSWCVEIIDVGKLGMCEGSIRHYKCACGDYEYWSRDNECMWVYDYENQKETCSECGTVCTWDTVKTEIDDCHTKSETTYTYTKDDEVILEYVDIDIYKHHDYRVTDVVMNDSTNCEMGYTETLTCKDCGYSFESFGSYHNSYVEKEYDLAEFGGCEGSTITYSKCHCGKYNYVGHNLYGTCDIIFTSNTYVDDDGYTHNVNVYRCETCGLRYTRDQKVDRDVAECMETITNTITIAVGDTAVDGFEYSETQPYHDYKETAELEDGSEDCDDGVLITQTCKNCGISNTYTSYGHSSVEVEGSRVDLSTLGSKCGGYVVHKQCACGKYSGLYLEDSDCDMSPWYSETPWLGEDYESQETTDGWHSLYRYAYRRTCAVTDPEQCGFSIRECDYYEWDKENCKMVEYTTWQLGYDNVNGTCQKEITVPTGRFAYHDYEVSATTDGTTTTTEEICTVCQSSRTVISRDDADGRYNEKELVNTLDNGERKYYHYISEDVYYNDYTYDVKDYYKYIYADGTEYWYSYDYEYDWDNFDCTCVRTYTDSYGSNNVTKEDCHRTSSYYERLIYATCSQYGEYKWTYKCNVCEAITAENVYDESPDGHYWHYDYDLGIYECYNCGLQNINGADGSVVLEDMTAEYGEDTNYVIGYWNKELVEYTYYLGVLYEDANEEVELILDIEFTELAREEDGINAVVFDQTKAEAAAEEAVKAEGYTGEYALRFTFVPVGSDGDFDYAITLTDKDVTQ